MLRNILRTSRWLARRPINIFAAESLFRNTLKISLQSSSAIPTIRQLNSSTQDGSSVDNLDPVVYEKICNETLESLYEYFEEIIDQSPNLKGADVTFSDGVLTIALGSSYGTYVINRQSPNKQIWLSSPTSGPKRYDLILDNGGYWIYKHDGITLHQLLQTEISKIASSADFKKCTHSLL